MEKYIKSKTGGEIKCYYVSLWNHWLAPYTVANWRCLETHKPINVDGLNNGTYIKT